MLTVRPLLTCGLLQGEMGSMVDGKRALTACGLLHKENTLVNVIMLRDLIYARS